ncbi:hypothetical protein LZ518_05325 [Sphingomonas sp. RB56-2]|jgi:hypothetical protein|uniref:Pentapeptide MXKDX repeat protein n=1 Tax=Sphingomonas brevis TaxID=2908206 RepID=A0ABT0S856_9SPHN|nr:hypothetical protein [Sphingomonas brevis]MCL6740552.1 hypothetical protein [Sphingomonas brevis]
MKMIIGALALALAVPAAAQTAPAADPHAGHQMSAQMQGMDHSQHQQGKHDCKDCCDKMKQSGGKMECMDKKGEAKPAAPASGGHTSH